MNACLRGGIGRRVGLKIQWYSYRVGSSPTAGTRMIGNSNFLKYKSSSFIMLKIVL